MMKKSFLLPALFTAALCAAAPDLDRFFAVPDFRELPPETEILSEKVEDGVRTRSLTFRGADFNGKPTRIFAWYSCPEKPGKYPGVLQIHGAGLTTLDPNPRWAKQGFACLVIDWAGEGKKRKTPRTPPTSVFEEAGGMAARQDGEWHIFGTERDSIRNGVLFARRALEFLRNQPEVDSGRLLAVGSSAGAHLTLLLLGYEPELRAAVVNYGCGYIRDLPGYFGGYFGPLALSPKAEQDEWLGCFDPKQRIGRYKADVLLLSGTDDIFFWMPLVLKTYREMPGVKRLLIRPNDNHQLVGQAETISAAFFRAALTKPFEWPDAPAPVVKEEAEKLRFTVTPAAGPELKQVQLVYKTMPVPFEFRAESKVPWKLAPMVRDGAAWSAELPAAGSEDQLVAYALLEDVHGNSASTDTVEVPQWPRWRGLPGEERRPKLAAGNLLGTDGEFESKRGFNFVNRAAVELSGEYARTGKGACHVFDGDRNFIARGIPARGGRPFKLTGWFRSCEPQGSARRQINWSKQGKLLKFDLKTPKITGEYQQLTLEGVIPEGAENGLLIITSPGGGMYIDDLDYRIGE